MLPYSSREPALWTAAERLRYVPSPPSNWEYAALSAYDGKPLPVRLVLSSSIRRAIVRVI